MFRSSPDRAVPVFGRVRSPANSRSNFNPNPNSRSNFNFNSNSRSNFNTRAHADVDAHS